MKAQEPVIMTSLRLPVLLHTKLAEVAKKHDVSFNTLVNRLLEVATKDWKGAKK